MKSLLLIAIGSALVNNVVLSQFLGLCPFLGVSKKVETAAGMGAAVLFVITIASAVTNLIYTFLLVPTDLTYLNTIVFILVIAALVQFVEMVLKKSMPALYESLGVFLPLITTNCAVLGTALTNVQNDYSFIASVVNGIGISLGFLIAIVILAGIREKMEYNNIPESFKGMPITLLTAGLMAIAFFGFSGLIQEVKKMNISAILLAMVVVGGTGLLIAILLGIASEKFKVPVDEKEVAIRAELPGNNCGGCGYAGCDGLAKAIANGEAPVNGCPVGGAAAAEKISAIMGVEAGEFVKKVAFVKCAGTCEKASDKYQYSGVQSCIEAMNVPGAGPKGCEFGCMGFGSCAAVCPENAISIVNGIAHIDEEACVGCGKCAETCPKSLIDLVPENKKTRVQCSSKEFGKNVMSVCKAGCIGCKACEKVCKLGAIKVENNIAQIDYDKCVGCGLCAGKCPKGIITGKKLVPKKPAPKKPVEKKEA